MIDPETARAIADELGLPLDHVRQTLADAERKPGVSDPIALAKAWLRKQATAIRNAPRAGRERTEPTPQPFFGWDEHGSCIRNTIPVTNPQTDFAMWLVREITDQALSPVDAVRLIAKQPEAIHTAFGVQNLREWARHGHCDRDFRPITRECDANCWPNMAASSALAEFVRSWGGTYPWNRNPDAWREILAHVAGRGAA